MQKFYSQLVPRGCAHLELGLLGDVGLARGRGPRQVSLFAQGAHEAIHRVLVLSPQVRQLLRETVGEGHGQRAFQGKQVGKAASAVPPSSPSGCKPPDADGSSTSPPAPSSA